MCCGHKPVNFLCDFDSYGTKMYDCECRSCSMTLTYFWVCDLLFHEKRFFGHNSVNFDPIYFILGSKCRICKDADFSYLHVTSYIERSRSFGHPKIFSATLNCYMTIVGLFEQLV